MHSTKGFTLIELIVVIILLSILGAVGIGLFSAPSQYAVKLSADQWLSQLQLAQRHSFLRQSASLPIQLSISQATNRWQMLLSQGATQLSNSDINFDSVNVHYSQTDFTSRCSSLPLITFPVNFYFAGYGNAVNASRVQLSTNQRVCLTASDTVELCISPSGYAYEGSCLP